MFFRHAPLVAALAGLALLNGCAGNVKQDEKMAAHPSLNNEDFYEVHHEGRVYLFDDAQTYRAFLSTGETPFRLTRIAAGPQGETLVFGLAKADKEKSAGIAMVDMYDGKLKGADDFYGEMSMDGRIYVFSSYDDMAQVRATGEASLRYTEIGAGPQGQTVVYVLNETTKKAKPVALIDAFHKANMN